MTQNKINRLQTYLEYITILSQYLMSVFLGSKFLLVAVLQILIQNVSIVQSAIEKLLS